MSCPTVTKILNTECIGNSLATINSNFTVLGAAACDNYKTVTTLLCSIQTLDNRVFDLTQKTPGIAKAWVKFDGTRNESGSNSTAATNRYIYSSYNIQSVYKLTPTPTLSPSLSAGDYQIVFKQGLFTSKNYAVIGTSSETSPTFGWLQPYSYQTTSVQVRVHSPTYPGPIVDPSHISVAIFG